MNNAWHVCVLVPARNEEQLLPRCLRSIECAVRHVWGHTTVDVIVAADHCTDGTQAIAGSILRGWGTALNVGVGSAGAARLLAARAALHRTRTSLQRCWIANTDADCIVPASWLSDQLNLAARGLEGFAGTVTVDSFEEHGPEVPDRFRCSYRIEPDGTHPHVHGANIGFRADAYVEVGGWAPLATAEDHDLWRRLKSANKRVLSTSRIEVVTSGRRVGRAPNGFAERLATHSEVGI